MSAVIHHGDCRDIMPQHGPFDMILADPPYGDTSLGWDRRVFGWQEKALNSLKPTGSMWVFGSLRFLLHMGTPAGFRYAQDIVWEKQNGTGFHADRFKRVHEHAVQFYRADTQWSQVYNDVQTTPDAVARVTRRKRRPTHTGNIEAAHYVSEDGGPRIMRSVIFSRNCHGRAIHPTEKPVDLLEVLIRTSCPSGGIVGDFFAGSGAGGEAAALSGRNYIGCELDPEYHAKASARLSGNLFGAAA